MRIGIDARFYGKFGKGLGRYTQQLIRYLEKKDTENEYFIFLREQNFSEYEPQNEHFQKVLADVPWYGFQEQIIMPKILRKYQLHLVHFPHFNVPLFYRGNFVVTLHDLILLRHSTRENSNLPFFLYAFKFYAYKYILHSCLKRASHILTVSEFSKNDILKKYPFLSSKKITVAYQPFFALYKKEKEIDFEYSKKIIEYGILKPYLLYVGNAYPHKNLFRLVQSFLMIQRNDICLVLVGKEDDFYKKLYKEFSEAVKEKKVIFTGEVEDEMLDVLYRNAQAFVFASLYEGFGLPPLEAMSRGIPVLSSRLSAMPEIQGNAPFYCNVLDEVSLGKGMQIILDNEYIRGRCIRRGYDRVKRYTWKKFIEKTHQVYCHALEKK